MIFSIDNDFVFLHCPRTSGTAISKSLAVLVPDARYDLLRKHCIYEELPKAIKSLRAFTVLRPFADVRRSYFNYVTKWYAERSNSELATRWLLEHANRLSRMSVEEYMKSDEPPTSVDGYQFGCDAVFQYDEKPYDAIAAFCKVDPVKFRSLLEVFRDS